MCTVCMIHTQNTAATGSIGVNSDNSYNYMIRFQTPGFIIDITEEAEDKLILQPCKTSVVQHCTTQIVQQDCTL